MVKRITISSLDLLEHKAFLESLFAENMDYWTAKAEITRHMKDKSLNYLIEVLACLVDSDNYELDLVGRCDD